MPVGDVFIGDSGGNVEHDDTTMAVDVVSVTKASELLLSCSIPDIELNITQVLCPVRKLAASGHCDGPTVLKPRGWTSTPRVAMYFFSNSPVKWRLTNVVCQDVSIAERYRMRRSWWDESKSAPKTNSYHSTSPDPV